MYFVFYVKYFAYYFGKIVSSYRHSDKRQDFLRFLPTLSTWGQVPQTKSNAVFRIPVDARTFLKLDIFNVRGHQWAAVWVLFSHWCFLFGHVVFSKFNKTSFQHVKVRRSHIKKKKSKQISCLFWKCTNLVPWRPLFRGLKTSDIRVGCCWTVTAFFTEHVLSWGHLA